MIENSRVFSNSIVSYHIQSVFFIPLPIHRCIVHAVVSSCGILIENLILNGIYTGIEKFGSILHWSHFKCHIGFFFLSFQNLSFKFILAFCLFPVIKLLAIYCLHWRVIYSWVYGIKQRLKYINTICWKLIHKVTFMFCIHFVLSCIMNIYPKSVLV